MGQSSAKKGKPAAAAANQSPKRYGLVFAFPGAPATPHVVGDFLGEFVAERPRALEEIYVEGQAEPLDYERAQVFARDPGCPLALVSFELDAEGEPCAIEVVEACPLMAEGELELALGASDSGGIEAAGVAESGAAADSEN